MREKSVRSLFAATGAAAMAISTPAIASPPLVFDLQASQAVLLLIGSGSLCLGYTYDTNGNRTAQTVTTLPPGAVTWGSAPYGCFLWSAP